MIMNKRKSIFLILLSAFIFTLLFHKQALGLNLLLFEIAFFIWVISSKQFYFIGKNQITSGIGFLFTSLSTVITHSSLSYIINFLTLIVFIGILNYPEARSLVNSFGLSINSFFKSQGQFLKQISGSKLNGYHPGGFFRKSRIFFIPLIIILIFIIIYRLSNPVFDELLTQFESVFTEKWEIIFKDFDFMILITFTIGLLLSNFIIIRTVNRRIIQRDSDATEELKRIKNKSQNIFSASGLKSEYKAAIFLLAMLNIILLIINTIDIYWVWFNFEWNGNYLKQFVHEGTYLLILSIIISIILVLYFFRGNLNFLAKNRLLKYLSYVWLAQNAVLAISVAIRNFWYIHYFSLAYKRIGVIIFLMLVIYGLYTVFKKVRYRKSVFFLVKSNAYSIFIVLIISSVINWDNLIAKYNFQYADTAFLHLDFMATLSDSSIPYLDKPLDELVRINETQKEKFPFEQKFMTPEEFHSVIESRKIDFEEKWKEKNFLSWNLSEYKAFRELKNRNAN